MWIGLKVPPKTPMRGIGGLEEWDIGELPAINSPTLKSESIPDLSVAVDDVLIRGQLAQPHRTAGVQAVGRDADLGAKAELVAVGETRRRVEIHRGGIHFSQELLPRGAILGNDGV